MSSQQEWRFGAHRAFLEGPDLLVVRYAGPARIEDAAEVVKIFREVCATQPRFLIVDVGRSSLGARVRKYLAEQIDPHWFSGVVYVGADFRARVVAKALSILVLFSAKMPYRMDFAADDAEAQAILAGWRERNAAVAGPPGEMNS